MRLRLGLLFIAGVTVTVLLVGLIFQQNNEKSSPAPTSARPSSSPIDTRAIFDSPPYWCDLVPQEALRRIAGVGTNLTETRSGSSKDQGGCMVTNQDAVYPLGVELQQEDSRATIDREIKQWQSNSPVRLPNELGYGFTVYAPGYVDDRPYIVSAAFRCGNQQPSIGIDMATVSRGRDYVADLTELMRIAQKRFGVVHKCTPGAAK
jgi:hypothetical protein